jgi:hypothetical protein
VAYRIRHRHPRMSGGFPASAVATGRWLAVIYAWAAAVALVMVAVLKGGAA